MGMYCRHGTFLLGTILEHLGVLFFCVFLCQKLLDSAAGTLSFLFSMLKADESVLATKPNPNHFNTNTNASLEVV